MATGAAFIKLALFSKLSPRLLNQLDFNGFFCGDKHIEQLREDLERELDHFVVSYKADICDLSIPLEAHLCALVKGAKLSLKQRKLLAYYETLSKSLGVTFVVYQNPIEYIDPYRSAIYSLYQKKGII